MKESRFVGGGLACYQRPQSAAAGYREGGGLFVFGVEAFFLIEFVVYVAVFIGSD